MISLRLRNWALYDWCAIILPLVNDPNGVSADDFGIQNPYIHIAFFMTISLEKMRWDCIHLFTICQKRSDSNFIAMNFFYQKHRFSKFTALKFETIQIKMTLTENQFLIFFSFSPKLIPFLSSLISNSFFHWLDTLILYIFCKIYNFDKKLLLFFYFPVIFIVLNCVKTLVYYLMIGSLTILSHKNDKRSVCRLYLYFRHLIISRWIRRFYPKFLVKK